MDRREVLKRTSVYMGGILSAPTMAALLNGCTWRRDPNWKPSFFTPEQAILVEDVAERILPKTDTPGAKEAGVAQFIESIVADIYDQKDRDRFMAGLADLDAQSNEKFDNRFVKCSQDQQYELLNTLNEQAIQLQKAAREKGERIEDPPFFLMIRELTISGFFRSEIGATQVARYEAVPGNYDGCISLEEAGGRVWAT